MEQVAQLELIVEERETQQAQLDEVSTPEVTKAAGEAGKRKRPVRKPLPDHLPRETVVHELTQSQRYGCKACKGCGGLLRLLGEDVAEVLEIVPARFKVVRHVRPKYSYAKCQTIVQAEAPSRPIAHGLAGPGLLAHVVVAKFADHLPLYRQSTIYARDGIVLELLDAGRHGRRRHGAAGPAGMSEAACWAHARRKFFDLHASTDSPLASVALERIGELYAFEQTICGRSPEERHRVRQEQFVPRLACRRTARWRRSR